jgi:NOL1/NOP2/sun family putative RNA methylase
MAGQFPACPAPTKIQNFMSVYFERYKEIVDDWPLFMEVAQRPLPTTIWANPLKTTPEQLVQRLQPYDIELTPIGWMDGAFRFPDDRQPGLLWEYMAGLFHVQEEVSMLPIKLLDVRPHHTVLDMCAAPGNKTAQFAVAMGNKGTIIANDRNVGRLKASRQIFDRLGIVNVTMLSQDAASLPGSMGQFDRILADVPCTCEGTCRKVPFVMSRASASSSEKMARVQTAILRKAVQLCKPGGKILYATCTFAPEENEAVLQAILDDMPDTIRILPAQVEGFVTAAGISEWNGRKFHPSMQNAIRIWPHHNDTGGFFMALIEKAVSPQPSAVSQPPAPNPQPPIPSLQSPIPKLCDRFGFSPELFADYKILRMSKRGLHIVNSDHQLLQTPKPDAIGMMFMRTDGKFPKMTTAAGMLFGKHATKNIIEITKEQAGAFFTRQTFAVSDAQIENCTGTGYVVLCLQNTAVGISVLHTKSQTIESSFPKGWVRDNFYGL